ncbi:MAG TPA: S8 family serine peptidase, partial [Symbiobacteriaceae bacterium]|nr:S8 family serine peptidase [Symbiobacteriaceae bacterium]
MRTRLFHRLAATLALTAIIASFTASSAAAAPARPAKGAPPSTIVGTKKGSKLDALTAPSVASFAAPARPNLRAQHRAQAELNQIKNQPYVPGQLIIKYKKNVTAAQAAAVRNEIKGTTLRKLDGGAELIQLAPGVSALSVSKSVARKTEIEYAEPNYIITKFDVTPTDALFGQLWGLKNTGQTAGTDGPGTAGIDIKAPLAWETTQGDSDLVVAVIDEGIDFSHPDLAGRAWVNENEVPGDGIDNDDNGYIDDINGWDFAHDDNTVFDVIDGDQHGTHVAGTIAASMDSLGVVGVAPNVKIASLKFLTDTAPNDTANAIEAIAYARKMGFKIINNSWGQYAYSQALKEAIESSYDTLFVAAAGNASYDMDNPMNIKAYPAALDLPNVISVAGIDNRGDLGWYSNWGATTVDVAAPGSQIFSTFPMNHILRGAAITNQTAAYKTVTLGFGLEDLTTNVQRTTLVDSVLFYFGADETTPITVILDDESTSDPTGTAYPSMRDEFEAALSGRANVTYHQLAHDAAITSDLLNPSHIVFWTTGQALGANHAEYRTLTGADLTNIAAYLNAGGRLFLSGQDALYGSELESVVTDMLGVDWQDEGATDTQLQGVSASLFDNQTFTLHDWPETYRDYLEPNPAVATARRVLTWPQGGAAKFEYMSGTSMASPHVAGVAALIKSVNQNMTPAQIRERIINTVTPLPDLAYKTVSGGMVDAAKALAYSPDNDVPGVPFPHWGAEVMDELDGATNTDMDDVYAVPLEAGQPIRATLTGADATDYDLYIYMPGTPTVNDVAYIAAGSENPGSAEAVNFVAPVSGIYYIDVFAYQGEGSYTLRAEWGNGPGAYEDNDSRLTYSGTWYDMGSWKESRAAGATAELKFYGNQVVVYGTKGPNMGLAAIGVNGVMQQVDLYAPVLTTNVPIYTKAGLPMTNQANVLTVRNLGQRSPQGRRTAISVGLDRVDIFVDTAAPPAIATFEAYPSDGSVELYWQYDRATVPDFAHFQVYRATDGGALEPMFRLQPVPASQGPRRAAAGAALSPMPWYYFEDLSAINGHDYTYIITAFDISGNESDDSPAVTAHPDPMPAPVTPHVQNLDGAVSIWWAPGTESDLSHYLVFRQQEGDPFAVVIATIPHDASAESLDYLDAAVTNETSYVYAVVAVDQYGVESDILADAAAHPSAAPAPVPYVEAYTNDVTVDLSWTAVSEAGITYLVERDHGDGTTSEVANTAQNSVTGLTANTAAPGLYYITSVDEWGVYGMPVAVATWPYQPLTVTPGNGQLTVTWATVPGATGYEVMTEGYVAPLPETATTFTLTDLTNGVEVCVWVEARTGTTARAQSNSVCATPILPDPPAAPVIATLTPGDQRMVITWNSVPGVDGYNVYRDGTRLNAGALDASTTSWTDTLPNNFERCWTVTSVKNGQESA